MTNASPSPDTLRVADLAQKPTRFALRPDAEAQKAWAEALGLDALRKLSFEGAVRPEGKRDWILEAKLGATIEQPCTVTLAPVRTRIDVPVTRRFLSDFTTPDTPEVEMPEDETIEALGAWIDLQAVMIEALSLEIPPYPRADGANFESAQFAEDGTAPLTDEAMRPFAGLAALREQMKDHDDES